MKPKIYFKDTHQISSKKIDKDAIEIIQRLKSKGFKAYAVGGCVRDLLLGAKPKDFDISTNAKPEEIKDIFSYNCFLIGRRFRLAHIRQGQKILEVSTFRSGDNEDDSLITHDNIWGTEEEDVLRRDFTINGLYYDPENETVIDYVGGYEDIQKKILRTIGDPDVRFRQDPVRMIRLLKFIARFNLNIDPHTKISIGAHIEEITKSSPDRILGEMFKMLESKASEPFFRLLQDFGLMQFLFPKISEFLQKDSNEQVFSLLKTSDSQQMYTLEKPVLFSCLLFPIIEKKILTLTETKGEHLHLGEIFNLIQEEIRETIAEPFPRFPRWIRKSMNFILTNQYRFTPLDPQKKLKINRLFFDKNFPLALRFLWLRAHIDEQCVGPYGKVKRLYQTVKKKYEENPKKPKKNKRRYFRKSAKATA